MLKKSETLCRLHDEWVIVDMDRAKLYAEFYKIYGYIPNELEDLSNSQLKIQLRLIQLENGEF